MIANMKFQIENPALLISRFVLDEVLFTNVDFHQLNLTRGSSYLPLPDWLAKKKAVINQKNRDKECFKWAVIRGGKRSITTLKEYLNTRDSKKSLIGQE